MFSAVASVPASKGYAVPRKVLLADADPVQRGQLEQVLLDRASGSVIHVGTGPELETAITEWMPDLVVSAVRLNSDSALQTLAQLRARGDRTPFIVYSTLRDSLVRVLVSSAEGTLLSSRVVDMDGLLEMANRLMDLGASSRRSSPS
jgi:DNA-binding NtrC family response regulator